MTAGQLLFLAKKAVEKAQHWGASHSEAYVIHAKELSIEVSNQAVETMKLAEERGIGIRVMTGGRMGFAYSSDLSDSAVDEIIRQSLNNAAKTESDPFNLLPAGRASYPALDLLDPRISQIKVEDKIALAKEIEVVARNYDPRVKITERSAYEDNQYEVTIVNSQGVEGTYQGAYCGTFAWLVAEENGESQTGFGMKYSLRYEDLDPNRVGKEAAEKAVRMLGAKTISTRKAPVVLDPYVVTNFLGVLAPALTAEAVQKGKSLLAGKVGQRVASPLITIIDDGAMAGGILSSPFDGEGVATGKTILLQDGLLQGYLYNTYTAAKEGVQSTGNGTRGSFKGTPEVGTTNFYLAPGALSREKLLQDIDQGLYITEVMGMHTANPISGDFSVGASGIWIEKGQLTYPVRGVAIAGNLLEVLQSIDGVADDLTFFVGKGAPTVRIASMTISGE